MLAMSVPGDRTDFVVEWQLADAPGETGHLIDLSVEGFDTELDLGEKFPVRTTSASRGSANWG